MRQAVTVTAATLVAVAHTEHKQTKTYKIYLIMELHFNNWTFISNYPTK